VAKSRLHLDADASIKALVNALQKHGHDVTRTPNDWMPADANDREQLLGATAQGRIIFTFNVRDFLVLSKKYPQHAGILLAAQSRWSLADLAATIERALVETAGEDWHGKVRWLNDFRSR
jgi:hypothetical protein